ncbi:uncharacterized protein IL334_001872 [Kwoniella shivajii]|uniref:Vacuolar fusion protein MON1 n=1 Tax=Kwoniella shivajii TaxID=564305 RepID=A0ABZ1CXB2_9TREE|nr:hypothetical protein IL334_001872 [Kwoniella shivajii]
MSDGSSIISSTAEQPPTVNPGGSGSGNVITSKPSFPPTPSRTTSQLSITSIGVQGHLSPPSSTTYSRRRRSHSNPSPSAEPNAKTDLTPNDITPTKRHHNPRPKGLLNASSSNSSLRSKPSVSTCTSPSYSFSRTNSSCDGTETISGSNTPNTGRAPNPFDLLSKGNNNGSNGSRHGTRSGSGSGSGSTTPTRKGKERQNHEMEINVIEVEGELSLSTDDVRKGLRDLVRRNTVTAGEAGEDADGQDQLTIEDMKDTKDDPHILESTEQNKTEIKEYTPRRYYVLTNAGKPVFSSQDKSSEDNITNLMAIGSTLISIFQEDDDKIRCIIKGKTRIGFLLKSPLYLFGVSDWGEPEHILRSHLEYIHLHILSVVSSTQLSRVFQRRSNYDLSRLLDGSETFLNRLIERSQYDFTYLTATLQPLRMNPATRDMAGAALMPPSKFNDLLYVLLIADGHIVTLLRPRKHAVHPSDLHLLLNTLASSSTLRSSETWLPICFPKFNPAGFVHAYISYVTENVGLVFVSADREAFEDLRGWKSIVLDKLEHDKTLTRITDAIPLHPYTVSAIGCPGLRHFIYKSRQYIQITQPEWEAPYIEDSVDRKRLITLYQKLHDAIHARSGQSQSFKLVYIRTEHEACLAWLTKPFELYLTVSPQLSKSAVVATANSVAKWVLAEEGRVFLKDAPVF